MKTVVGFVLLTKLPPLPLIMLHDPVPTVAAFAVRVTDVVPQVGIPVWSRPAAAVVGGAFTVMVASAVEGVHGALEVIVHRTI